MYLLVSQRYKTMQTSFMPVVRCLWVVFTSTSLWTNIHLCVLFIHENEGLMKNYFLYTHKLAQICLYCWEPMHFNRETGGESLVESDMTISDLKDKLCELYRQKRMSQNKESHSISADCPSCCAHSFLSYLAVLCPKRKSVLQIHQTTSIFLLYGCHWVRSRCVPEQDQSSWSGIWRNCFHSDCG